jgi:tetratricopeptide (TPR) repeat protein
MGSIGSWVRGIFAACWLALSVSAAFADELTDRARRLLERHQAQEAYQLLSAQESQRAGQPDFDYLLGIAALDSGQPERAIFALERVLAVQPENHLARAEIARAYVATGEREAARREFEALRGQPIPGEAKANIERFLAAMRAADTTRWLGYIEVGGGYDTNVNAATASSQVAVPAFNGAVFTLDPAFTSRHDIFGMVSGGVNVTHKLDESWAVLGAANGAARMPFENTRFDQMILDGSLGARWSRGKEAITLGGQLQTFEVDWARYRDTTGAVLQWQHSYDERHQASLFGQYAQLRYPSQSIRDADRTVLGAAYGKVFTTAYAPVLFTSAYLGEEKERAAGVPHLGHDLWGARIGGQLRLGSGWGVIGSAAYEERRYGGPEPFFLDTRKDRQFDLTAGVSYLLRANTIVLAQVAYTDNRSNIPLFAFDRTVTSLSVRFNF